MARVQGGRTFIKQDKGTHRGGKGENHSDDLDLGDVARGYKVACRKIDTIMRRISPREFRFQVGKAPFGELIHFGPDVSIWRNNIIIH